MSIIKKIATIAVLTSLTQIAYATRSLSITANKSALSGDEEMAVTASASGFTAGEQIYIKGAFFKEGSTNYFGYTKSGDSFVKNSANTTDQLQALIDSWNKTLTIKSDYGDTGFSGDGTYKFKVRYYLASDPSTGYWSTNELSISLAQPTPTPTVAPTPEPTATPTPTPQPTGEPTTPPTGGPTKKPTTTPTKKPSPAPTETVLYSQESDNSTSGGYVLGETAGSPVPLPNSAKKTNSASVVSIVFIVLGALLTIGFGVPLILPELRKKKGSNEQK